MLMPSAPMALTMASNPSANTTTSTTAKQDPMPSQQSTAHGKKESGVTVTSSTPNPAPTSLIQKYVTDAAEIISATPAYRKMFIAEVFKNTMKFVNGRKILGKHLQKFQNLHQLLESYQFMQFIQTTVMINSSLQGQIKFWTD